VVEVEFVVAVGDQQQRPGLVDASSQEHQQVQGRLIGPVGVLDHDDLWPGRLVELVQEGREQPLPRAPGGQQGGRWAAGLAGNVVQGPERRGVSSGSQAPSRNRASAECRSAKRLTRADLPMPASPTTSTTRPPSAAAASVSATQRPWRSGARPRWITSSS
jgi:hypothetical protein